MVPNNNNNADLFVMLMNLTNVSSSVVGELEKTLMMMLIFTMKVVISTVRRALTLDGGMRNDTHDKNTLMQEMMDFTTVMSLTVFALLKPTFDLLSLIPMISGGVGSGTPCNMIVKSRIMKTTFTLIVKYQS